ncbi:hypothetical protein ACLOJK_037999, partial [Asimina triloba]
MIADTPPAAGLNHARTAPRRHQRCCSRPSTHIVFIHLVGHTQQQPTDPGQMHPNSVQIATIQAWDSSP